MKIEKSCGAIVFTLEDGAVKYVLVQEKDGSWSFPNGRAKVFETEEGGAYRAVEEKLRMKVDLLSGFCEAEEHPVPDRDTTERTVYFCAEFSDQEIVLKTDELLDAQLLSLDEARELLSGKEKDREDQQPLVRLLEKADGFIRNRVAGRTDSRRSLREKRSGLLPATGPDPQFSSSNVSDEFRRKVEEMMFMNDGDGSR